MSSISLHPLPVRALLFKYAISGTYTDCFATDIPRTVTQAEFVETFYTGKLFKLERLLIGLLASKPSTDLQARQLALGELNEFAAWRVEARADDQLLMCDLSGGTRSWLMVSAAELPGRTRLYFGSAVVPAVNRSTGKATMGFVFKALLGFHKLYSRALLGEAARRLS